MNNLYVEADKSFQHGFLLSESELRRITQLMIEQLKKEGCQDIFHNFFIKFENGTIAETENIDQIFSIENSGSNKIVYLSAVFQNIPIDRKNTEIDDKNINAISFSITFNDIDSENNSSTKPIRYIIKGKSRDWVMVSSSLLEERINKVKKKSFIPKAVRKAFLLLLMLSLMMAMFYILLKPDFCVSCKNEALSSTITEIEEQSKNNPSTSVIDAILKIEKSKITQDKSRSPKILWLPMGFMFLFLLITVFESWISSTVKRMYPNYNFYWADYIEEYNKREKFRKSVITFLVITLIIGIGVNLASSFIWQKLGF
jgi:hypothetical protein